jgi:hypothetical protein
LVRAERGNDGRRSDPRDAQHRPRLIVDGADRPINAPRATYDLDLDVKMGA